MAIVFKNLTLLLVLLYLYLTEEEVQINQA